jgi:hypothetical protein
MILTTLLRLGAKAGNEWKEHAGVSGIYEDDNDIAFWAGGTLEDAVSNLANMIIRMDGSGQLAKGNILWDLTLSGKFESNKNDNKIVIDPASRSIQLIDPAKGIVGNWSFFATGSILTVFNKPSETQEERIQINGNGISFLLKNTGSGIERYSRIGATGMVFDTDVFPDVGSLDILETGAVYRDGNILNLKSATYYSKTQNKALLLNKLANALQDKKFHLPL